MPKEIGFTTNQIHAGEDESSSATPIYQSATSFGGYLRGGNPTLEAFENKMLALEGGKAAVSTACGMAAVSQTLLALLKPGDRVLCHQTVYYWTTELMTSVLPKFGVQVEMIDMTDLTVLQEALSTETSVVYFEPLANPKLDVIDTEKAIALAKKAGAVVVVDNTYLSPYLLRPLTLGADIVVHSATKFLCGHGDALAGIVIAAESEYGEMVSRSRNIFGGILSPMNAFLLLRGIKTLSMRMDRHCSNAQSVAEFLDAHPHVNRVFYPGLTSSPGHKIAKAQWQGFGGMVSFEVDGQERLTNFLEGIELCKPWVSLGDVGTLAIGQGGPNRVRMSVGLEDVDDITRDIGQALGT
ncbi:MAG: PLP-dependent transferase [Candidatus Latescibacteria bacterium]|nr:PLP-dependent transferase [Candidatus Latescibacterota bacterium]